LRTVYHRLVVSWEAADNVAANSSVVTPGITEAPYGLRPNLLLPVPACMLLVKSSLMNSSTLGSGHRRLDAEITTRSDLASIFDDRIAAADQNQHKAPIRRLQSGTAAPTVPMHSYDVRNHAPLCHDGNQVVDQGECSGAWAVAAVGATGDRLCQAAVNMTNWHQVPGGPSPRQPLSAQRVISCTGDGAKCAGGSVYAAFRTMKGPAGVVPEPLYPYQSRCWNQAPENMMDLPMSGEFQCDRTMVQQPQQQWPCECRPRMRQVPACDLSVKATARVVSFYRMPTILDTDQKTGNNYGIVQVIEWMQQELITRGPYVVGLELYEDFFFTKFANGGVYACSKSFSYVGGHAVVLVGWGRGQQPSSGADTPYWLVRNSFGRDWGDNGHFRVVRADMTSSGCLV